MRCPACNQPTIVNHYSSEHQEKVFFCLSCHQAFPKRARRPSKWLKLGGVIGALIALPFLTLLPLRGLLELLPKVNKADAETIVILGRGPAMQARFSQAASDFWWNHQDLNIFTSGMTDAPEMAHFLQEMGVPTAKIQGERCSQSTWENGLFSELLLNGSESNKIVLVTDSFHMPRAVKVFEGFGFKVYPYPVEPNRRWYSVVQMNRMAFREYAALIYYALSRKLKPLPPPERHRAEVEATFKVKDWGCQIHL